MFLSLLGARSCPKWSGVSIALTVENRIFARGSPGVRSSNASHVRKWPRLTTPLAALKRRHDSGMMKPQFEP